MVSFNTKWTMRTGLILIAVSVVLLGISGYGILSTNNNQFTKVIPEGGYITVNTTTGVSQGDEIAYTVSTTGNVSVELIGPSGIVSSNYTVSPATPLNKVVVSNASGVWAVKIYNTQAGQSYVHGSLGYIAVADTAMLYLGLALLPSGVVLLMLYFSIRRREKKLSDFNRSI